MGWLTDIGVSRLLGQQGTTGGTSRAVNRPQLRGAGLEPYTGKGSSLTVAVGHWRLPSPAGLTHLVITLPDSGWNRAIRRARRSQKSCAESLHTTHSRYPSDFSGVTPAFN